MGAPRPPPCSRRVDVSRCRLLPAGGPSPQQGWFLATASGGARLFARSVFRFRSVFLPHARTHDSLVSSCPLQLAGLAGERAEGVLRVCLALASCVSPIPNK